MTVRKMFNGCWQHDAKYCEGHHLLRRKFIACIVAAAFMLKEGINCCITLSSTWAHNKMRYESVMCTTNGQIWRSNYVWAYINLIRKVGSAVKMLDGTPGDISNTSRLLVYLAREVAIKLIKCLEVETTERQIGSRGIIIGGDGSAGGWGWKCLKDLKDEGN
jgi:hypothetical protein